MSIEQAVVEEMFYKLVDDINRRLGIRTEPSAYSCILLNHQNFHQIMQAILTVGIPYSTRTNFLDVGAGVGHKLLLASGYGHDVVGIEKRKDYVEEGIKLLELLHPTTPHSTPWSKRLICADAFQYEHYDDFEVIYFYRPIPDQSLQTQLEEKIVSAMRSGCVLVGVGNVSLRTSRQVVQIHSQEIYVKK